MGHGLITRPYYQLVDADLAETTMPGEALVGCSSDHKDIWNVPSDPGALRRVKDILDFAATQSEKSRVQQRMLGGLSSTTDHVRQVTSLI